MKRSLKQALIRPSPGWTPGHCAIISAMQAFATRCCAIVADVHVANIRAAAENVNAAILVVFMMRIPQYLCILAHV